MKGIGHFYKQLLLLISFTLLSMNCVQAKVIVSADAFYQGYEHKALTEHSVKPIGLSQVLSVALLNKRTSFGAYISKGSMKSDLIHDGETSQIQVDTQVFGVELAYYFNKLFVSASYGKISIDQKLISSSSTQKQNLIHSLYEIEDSPDETEIKAKLGFKLYDLKHTKLTLNLERRLISTGASVTSGGIGLKLQF